MKRLLESETVPTLRHEATSLSLRLFQLGAHEATSRAPEQELEEEVEKKEEVAEKEVVQKEEVEKKEEVAEKEVVQKEEVEKKEEVGPAEPEEHLPSLLLAVSGDVNRTGGGAEELEWEELQMPNSSHSAAGLSLLTTAAVTTVMPEDKREEEEEEEQEEEQEEEEEEEEQDELQNSELLSESTAPPTGECLRCNSQDLKVPHGTLMRRFHESSHFLCFDPAPYQYALSDHTPSDPAPSDPAPSDPAPSDPAYSP
uniref:Uncharacterized protein n=1 Tax=Knipowitschia caucasica TaxID=637954 RepID=A0AAV2JN38_KNICA